MGFSQVPCTASAFVAGVLPVSQPQPLGAKAVSHQLTHVMGDGDGHIGGG